MNSQVTHTMYLDRQLPDGTQEWICPTCGRRILMQWPPLYPRTVLVPGDESIPHSGAMNAVSQDLPGPVISEQAAFPVESLDIPDETVDKDDPYLLPWMEWVERQNI